MTLADIASIATIVALGAVLYQLRHIRATNFISAWKAIEDTLQSEPVRIGRGVSATLTDSESGTTPRVSFPNAAGWSSTLDYLGSYHGLAPISWTPGLLGSASHLLLVGSWAEVSQARVPPLKVKPVVKVLA